MRQLGCEAAVQKYKAQWNGVILFRLFNERNDPKLLRQSADMNENILPPGVYVCVAKQAV